MCICYNIHIIKIVHEHATRVSIYLMVWTLLRIKKGVAHHFSRKYIDDGPLKARCTGHLTCPLPSALSIFPSLEVPWLPSSRCAASSAPGTSQKLSQYLPRVLWVSMPAFLLEPTPSVYSSTISLLGSWTALVPNSWTSPKIHFIFGIFPGMHLTGNMFSKSKHLGVNPTLPQVKEQASKGDIYI